MKKSSFPTELAITLVLFLFVNVICQITQHQITINNGQGWDGVYYFKVAEQLANHVLPNTNAPFVYRIGTPLIVSLLFKNNIMLGFKVINIVGNLITTTLFLILLRLFLKDTKTRLFLVTLFLFAWVGPVRYVYYYPVYVDPWLFVALLSGLIGIYKIQEIKNFTWICLLGLITFIGVILRESSLIIPIAFLFSVNPIVLAEGTNSVLETIRTMRINIKIPVFDFIPLGLGILSILAVHSIATQTNSYSYFRLAIYWVFHKPPLEYLLAWFTTFGPIIVILFYFWRGTINFLLKHQYLLIYILGIFVLAWIGGSNTERILSWSMPIIYILIGKLVEDNHIFSSTYKYKLVVLILIIGQLFSERVFGVI